MKSEPLTTIEREVKSWPGVTTGDTGRGGLQFNYGIELFRANYDRARARAERRAAQATGRRAASEGD